MEDPAMETPDSKLADEASAVLSPDMMKFVWALLNAPGPRTTKLPPDEARRRFALARAQAPEGPRVAETHDVELNVEGRLILVRRYEPVDPHPGTIVFLHGGGWTLGSVALSDASARAMAVATKRRVMSVGYSLAPENPYPAALQEVFAVVDYVRQAYPGDVILAGESAGANLAAVAAATLQGVGAQILIYPVLDHDLTRSSYDDPVGSIVLSREDMQQFWLNYMPDARGRGDPSASPLRSKLDLIPPTFIAVAERDVLRDEAEAYASRLAGQDKPVVLRRYAGTVHGFFSVPSRFAAARLLLEDVVDFLLALPQQTVQRGGVDGFDRR